MLVRGDDASSLSILLVVVVVSLLFVASDVKASFCRRPSSVTTTACCYCFHRNRPPLCSSSILIAPKRVIPSRRVVVLALSGASASSSSSSEVLMLRITSMTTLALDSFWNLATKIGMHRLGRMLKRWYPSAYGGTTFYFEGVQGGYVALTIDDGLSRRGRKTSMVTQVRDLLQAYSAHATFFVCSNYITKQDATVLLQDGHQLGNHLGQDIAG